MDRERRPAGPSYVITLGTFLIGSLENYLFADTEGSVGSAVAAGGVGALRNGAAARLSRNDWAASLSRAELLAVLPSGGGDAHAVETA